MHYRTQESCSGKVLTGLTNAAQNISSRNDALLAALSFANTNTAPTWVNFYSVPASAVVVGATVPSSSIALNASTAGHVVIDYTGATGAMSCAATATPGGSTAPASPVAVCVFTR
jgi:hypothetical protein